MRVLAKINGDAFNLINDEVKQEDITTLCAQKTEKIKTINLSRTSIPPPLLLQLWEGNWKSLESLYLHANKMGDKGCKYVSRATLPALAIIDLRYNNIGTAGLSHLSKGAWKKLKDLNLEVNAIAESGMSWIVKGNWAISDLSLRWNKISALQLQGLLLSHSGDLLSLELSNNLIEKEAQNAIKKQFTDKSKISSKDKVKFQISF